MSKVGDKIWRQDLIRRSDGSAWIEDVISGETPKSWLVGYHSTKVNKNTMVTATDRQGCRDRYYTKEQMLAKKFCDRNAHAIASAVSVCRDVDKLRQIAAILEKEVS